MLVYSKSDLAEWKSQLAKSTSREGFFSSSWYFDIPITDFRGIIFISFLNKQMFRHTIQYLYIHKYLLHTIQRILIVIIFCRFSQMFKIVTTFLLFYFMCHCCYISTINKITNILCFFSYYILLALTWKILNVIISLILLDKFKIIKS